MPELIIIGFCCPEAKLNGPLHSYVAPVTVVAVSFIVSSWQIGLLLPATGVAGVGCTITVTVSAADVQLFLVAVRMYAPDCVGIALGSTGF